MGCRENFGIGSAMSCGKSFSISSSPSRESLYGSVRVVSTSKYDTACTSTGSLSPHRRLVDSRAHCAALPGTNFGEVDLRQCLSLSVPFFLKHTTTRRSSKEWTQRFQTNGGDIDHEEAHLIGCERTFFVFAAAAVKSVTVVEAITVEESVVGSGGGVGA